MQYISGMQKRRRVDVIMVLQQKSKRICKNHRVSQFISVSIGEYITNISA